MKWLISLLSQWVDKAGGMETLGKILLRRKKTKEVPQFTPPEVNAYRFLSDLCLKTFNLWLHLRLMIWCEQQTVEALLESGYSLIKEQKLIMETKLSKEYMKNIDD